MNKEEFLNKLRKKLNVLEDKEIEDIVSEYAGYIEEKTANRMTEEEAVKELGDFNEIVNDLLAAYKVKASYEEESGFSKAINKLSTGIDNFATSLSQKSGTDIIKMLIEIIIILFLICLLKIPFNMIKDLGGSLFEELAHPVGNVFYSIWSFIIELSYIIVSVIFFIKMLEKRYFQNISDEIVEETKKETKKTVKETKKTEPVQQNNNQGFIHSLSNVCIVFLKFIVIMILIGIIFYLIGMSVAVGFMIYLITQGVKYFGILILIVAMFLGGAFLLDLGIHFVFNRKVKGLPCFIKLITIIVITGLGLTFSAIEIANTEIIYDANYGKVKKTTKEIAMTPNLRLYNYDRILIDNTLGNNIRIEYTYPDFGNMDVVIDLDKYSSGYHLQTKINHASWNKELLNNLIESLKDRKIYAKNYYIEKTIYVSEANYSTLINNEDDYHNDDKITFTKTYDVSSINECRDENYKYLIINEINDEVETVKVPTTFAKDLRAGNLYDFTFECVNNGELDDTEDTFERCKLINVKLNSDGHHH